MVDQSAAGSVIELNFNRLRCFAALCEEGTFSGAAKVLGLSQPAVSQHIKALEEHLGLQLFTRGGEAVKLSPQAEGLYLKVKEILKLWAEAENLSRRAREGVSGRLAIAASTIPGEYLLPPLVARFRRQWPEVEIALSVSDSADSLARLRAGTAHLAAVGFLPKGERFEAIAFSTDELSLILPLDHPLISGSAPETGLRQESGGERSTTQQSPFTLLSPSALKSVPFVIREKGSGTRAVMLAALSELGITEGDLSIALEVGSTASVIAAVESGVGVSLVSRVAAERAARLGRVAVGDGLLPPITRSFYLAYRTDLADMPALQEFVRFAAREV